MKRILFERSENAYLPEIDAYIAFLRSRTNYEVIDSSKLDNPSLYEFDLIWKFMGTDFKSSNIPVIHDYASLSTGKFPYGKNWIKRTFNKKPALRIFLNENVKEGFNFKDNTPFIFRDMGIPEPFFIQSRKKEFDFVYMGALSSERNIDKLLNCFTINCPNKTLLLIGQPEDDIYGKYKHNSNFIFTGRLNQVDVPSVASKAIYGVNYIPNKYPYNLQTSTKLLEYLAMNLKVITTDYLWIRQFEEKNKMKFLKVGEDLSGIQSCQKFIYQNKSVNHLKWDYILENSRILSQLDRILNEKGSI